MDEPLLKGIRACVFDAYGTLFDFGSAARACRARLGDKAEALTQLWRDKQLQYTWLRAVQGRHADFWQVTGDALDFALATLKLDQGARDELMQLYLTLDTFPEAHETLRKVKGAGLKTAILSNGSPAMLEPLLAKAQFGASLLDAVFSVEQAGVYKPHPKVYQLPVDGLGVRASEILLVSANAWDAFAASAFGMRVAWCNRYNQRPEKLPGNPDRVVGSLAEIPALIGA